MKLKDSLLYIVSWLVWTPARFISTYSSISQTSSGLKWIYFQFQSKLVHAQASVVISLNVPFYIALFIFFFSIGSPSKALLYYSLPLAMGNFLIFMGSWMMERFCPKIEYKMRYVFIFMAFFATFELFGLIFSDDHEFFETQLVFGTLLFALLQLIVFFQWSTIISSILCGFYLMGFAVLHIGHISNWEEVSYIFVFALI